MSVTAWFIFGVISCSILSAVFVTARLANVLKMSFRDMLTLLLTASQSTPPDSDDDDF